MEQNPSNTIHNKSNLLQSEINYNTNQSRNQQKA